MYHISLFGMVAMNCSPLPPYNEYVLIQNKKTIRGSHNKKM
jgi:hypothetical protein